MIQLNSLETIVNVVEKTCDNFKLPSVDVTAVLYKQNLNFLSYQQITQIPQSGTSN